MRSQDKAIFLEAARQFQIWILVRRTNRASLEYVGRPGYTPKRIDCKAKTADIDIAPYRLAGLVVDPGIHPKAFKPGKAAKAAACWAAMKPLLGELVRETLRRPQGAGVVPSCQSITAGCIHRAAGPRLR